MIHANQLIARLGWHDRRRLLSIGEDVRLSPGNVLFECGEDAASVFFPTEGAVVLTVPSAPTRGLGSLLVGTEGMLGMHRVLGDHRSTKRATAQTSGSGVRINAPEFGRVLEFSHTPLGVMLDYVGGVVNQAAAATA